MVQMTFSIENKYNDFVILCFDNCKKILTNFLKPIQSDGPVKFENKVDIVW